MRNGISWITRLGFGLGKINTNELNYLSSTFSVQQNVLAVKEIKVHVSEAYYRNLEFRVSQSIKKEILHKSSLEILLRQLRNYNWCNIREEENECSKRRSQYEIKESIRTLDSVEKSKFQHMKFNEVGIKEYNINNTFPRYYFKDGDGNIKHMGRRPLSCLFENKDFNRGANKYVQSRDKAYVELKLINALKVKECNEFNALSANKLKTYPSICSSFFVNRNTMIARNGGCNLYDIRNKEENRKIFELNQFKPLLHDLSDMQEKNMFMTDIKLENLVFNDINGGNIKLIDLDSISKEGHCLFVTYSPENITPELFELSEDAIKPIKARLEKDNNVFINEDERKLWEQACANLSSYALLVSMIEATTGKDLSFQNKKNTQKSLFPYAIGNSLERMPEQMIRCKIAKDWINENVEEKEREEIHRFSENPHQHKGLIKWTEILIFNKQQKENIIFNDERYTVTFL